MALTRITTAQISNLLSLIDAVDDAAAAIAGVQIGGMYRTGSLLKVRLA